MFRLFPALWLAACSVPSETLAPTPHHASRVAATSADAFGVLAFLHDGGTTRRVLDDEVGLDRRAAQSLIAHRDGPDGLYGTQDDRLFESIEMVDAQYYVGPRAISKLVDHARQHGFVPSDDDVVGVWDGVGFTLREAGEVLALANEASLSTLDVTIALDARAARGIVGSRPVPSLASLAEVPYVGRSALNKLRAYAATQRLGAAWDDCNTSADCMPGLVCMGELAWGSGIQCVDDTMYDNFTHDEALEIPDNGETLSTHVMVTGLATVPVDVVLTLDIEHPRPEDLVVTIDNFNGYSQVIWNRDPTPESEVIVRAFPSDDMVNGKYNVHIQDVAAGETGELRGWNLYIVSNWD